MYTNLANSSQKNDLLLIDSMSRRLCDTPRKEWDSLTAAENSVYQTGDLVVDRYAKTIYKKGQTINLTPTEYEIVLFLVDNVTLVCPKDAVRNMIKIRFHRVVSDNTISKHIGRVRTALGQNAEQEYIVTRWTNVYKWNLPVRRKFISRRPMDYE